MSACELTIRFDDGRQTYRGGDDVHGEVRVRPARDVTCRRLVVQRYWQTHGRGDRDTGGRRAAHVVSNLQWRAGQEYVYRFHFKAPSTPVTYHGHHINVDHYVEAQADIPRARDVKAVEEFYVEAPAARLSPGGPPSPRVFEMETRPTVAVPADIAMILVAFIIAYLAFPVGLVALPVLAVVLFLRLSNQLAEAMLGNVTVRLGALAGTQAQRVPISIQLYPKNEVTLNRVFVTLIGTEKAVAGSGSDRKTYRHTLYEGETVLATAVRLRPGRPEHLKGEVVIPDDAASSFWGKHNKIQWEIKVRIDVPSWPDWKCSTEFKVRPGRPTPPVPARPGALPRRPSHRPESPDVQTAAPVPAAKDPVSSPDMVEEPVAGPIPSATGPAEPRPDWFDGLFDDRQAAPSTAETPASATETATPPSTHPLVIVAARIADADRFSGDQDRLAAGVVGTKFDLDVTVHRVEWTYGFDVAEAFRNGRTLIGVVCGTDTKVALRLRPEDNSRVDGLGRDARIRVAGPWTGWDKVYGRAELEIEALEVLGPP